MILFNIYKEGFDILIGKVMTIQRFNNYKEFTKTAINTPLFAKNVELKENRKNSKNQTFYLFIKLVLTWDQTCL